MTTAPPLPSKSAVQVFPPEASGAQALVAKTISDIRRKDEATHKAAHVEDNRRWRDVSLLLPEHPGCGFQGIFLQDDDVCIDRYVQSRVHACMAKWDENPAHPPEECLFQPSEECVVDF